MLTVWVHAIIQGIWQKGKTMNHLGRANVGPLAGRINRMHTLPLIAYDLSCFLLVQLDKI